MSGEYTDTCIAAILALESRTCKLPRMQQAERTFDALAPNRREKGEGCRMNVRSSSSSAPWMGFIPKPQSRLECGKAQRIGTEALTHRGDYSK